MSMSLTTRITPLYEGDLKHATYRLSTIVIENGEELRPYLVMLDDLMEETSDPNLYYESWMVRPAIKSFTYETNTLFMLILATDPVTERRFLCGFIPLTLNNRYRGLPIRNITLWHYPHCFLATPILHRDFAERCMDELMNWFKHSVKASFMVFNLLPSQGLFYNSLSGALTKSGLSYTETKYNRAVIEPAKSADEYFAQRAWKKVVSEDKRRRRNLSALGELEWDTFKDEGKLETWIDEFLEIEGSGWKGESKTALRSSEANRTFFREIMWESYQRSRLRILSLRLNRKPIAMIVIFLGYGGGHLFKMAFDESYRKYAPGVMLNLEMTRMLHEWDDVNWIDTCAAYDNGFANRLWSTRKPLCNLVIAKPFTVGALVVKILPRLSKLRKRLATLRKR